MYNTIKIKSINGKTPIEIKRGTPIFLGQYYPSIPPRSTLIGWAIGIDGCEITTVIGGFGHGKLAYDALAENKKSEQPVEITIINDRALFLMDASIVEEIII